MAIQLIGAGVGRTGTMSLKHALEQLLGGTCHHMLEVDEAQLPIWASAYQGEEPDWHEFLAPYNAIVDWPGASLWREMSAAFPEAPVLLSTRASTDVWWTSADNTIMKAMRTYPPNPMSDAMLARFGAGPDDQAGCMAAYEAHNAAVRDAIPADRLFEYQPGDGWGPLCAALGMPEPDVDFPHTNTTAQFQERVEKREQERAERKASGDTSSEES